MRISPFYALALLALIATPATAQRGGGLRAGGGLGAGQGGGVGRELLQACGVDLRAYCSGVQPGGGRIAQCMRQNWDKLSPACQKTALAARGGGQSATPAAPAAASTPAPPAAPPSPAASPPS